MTMNTKKEVVRNAIERYLAATRKEKKAMLNEWSIQFGMHRKAVIRLVQRLNKQDSRVVPPKRGRRERYGPVVTVALKEVWEMASELCGERLHPILSEYIRIVQRDLMWEHAKDTTALLLRMSIGTMKRRIAHFRSIKRTQRHSTTTHGLLIATIPIRHGKWDNPLPGFGEIDTVVHCGSTLAGDMAYTINYTDISTTWWEGAAQMNKGQERTKESIACIRQRLPFPLAGLDPDNGSEFINYVLKQWCDEHHIVLTRSRPYKKNDNAHIEQKNGAITRQFLGYQRIDTEEQVALVNQLYAGPLRLYINFFQPSMKCIGKERVGSRYRRSYDKPKTPYKRVLEHQSIDEEVKKALSQQYATLNPLKLKQEIDMLIKKIFSIKKP
jgi:hypothetical protein